MISASLFADSRQAVATQKLTMSAVDVIVFVTLLACTLHGYTLSQHLIESAKVDFLQERVLAVDQAWHTFVRQYDAIPGDFAYASVHIDSDLINGDGNGRIDTDVERGQAWAHLVSAGLLPAIQTDGLPTSENPSACPLTRCPSNSRGQAMLLSYGNYGPHFTHESNQLLLGSNIPARTLWGLDQRLDDGAPSAGKIQVNQAAANFSDAQMNQCLDKRVIEERLQNVRCAGVVELE